MPAQGRIVLLFLYPAGMEFFIFRGHVARRTFALLSCLSAFQYNVFSRHDKVKFGYVRGVKVAPKNSLTTTKRDLGEFMWEGGAGCWFLDAGWKREDKG